MSRMIAAAIDIPAERELVWEVLSDARSYPLWNPFLTRIHGQIAPGERLSVEVDSFGRGRFNLQTRIVDVREGQGFRWKGRALFPGLLRGDHSFMIGETETGVRFVQTQRFDGIALRWAERVVETCRLGMREMNRALADEVAARVARQRRGVAPAAA